MPIVLALAIRSIVQLGVTLAIYTTAEAFIKAGMPLLVKLISSIFGITEQEAKNFLHDFMIDQAVAFGLTVLALRKQMPTIVAEYLGFTSKGFSKLGFVPAVKAKIEKTIGTAAPVVLTSGWGAWSPVMKLMSVITGVFMLTQSIEVFAYRPRFFTNILNFVGLGKATEKLLIPPPATLFSNIEINQFANSLKISGDEMNGLLEAATEVVRSQAKIPTQANVMKIIREDLLAPGAPGATAPARISVPAIPAVKVFTGVISQSTIAAAVPFIPRQDDLIENMDELRQAAQNNEAPFMAALPGRIIREIKIVSSVTTRDGFTQRGTAQQVISGYRSDGTAKYRTVVNKFAVADIYIMTEKGARTKISRIVYGPVDSTKFKPDQNEILTMETALRSASAAIAPAITQMISAPSPPTPAQSLTGGLLPAPATVPPPVTKIEIVPRDYFVNYGEFYTQVFYIQGDVIIASPEFASILPQADRSKYENLGTQTAEAIRQLVALGYPVNTYPHKIFHGEINGKQAEQIRVETFEKFFGTTITITTTPAGTSLPPGALSAGTLYEFYTAQGLPLPSVSQRALIYEKLELGQSGYYTGTAEQNAKLLAKLQGKF